MADALAVDLLARADATTLAVFGTGHQAAYEVAAVSRIRPVEEVWSWDGPPSGPSRWPRR
ncbi:ornithine cyclodeaminase [Streptomyces azureus]|uniref:Ornithine cyclodeaminase n=1 Tax=Streptomyces azureus TaxID=146537 RepID=A0A0K8PYG0_STRAJ|nr:ornithine cyclodeaminase [Streptomyces azureus]